MANEDVEDTVELTQRMKRSRRKKKTESVFPSPPVINPVINIDEEPEDDEAASSQDPKMIKTKLKKARPATLGKKPSKPIDISIYISDEEKSSINFANAESYTDAACSRITRQSMRKGKFRESGQQIVILQSEASKLRQAQLALEMQNAKETAVKKTRPKKVGWQVVSAKKPIKNKEPVASSSGKGYVQLPPKLTMPKKISKIKVEKTEKKLEKVGGAEELVDLNVVVNRGMQLRSGTIKPETYEKKNKAKDNTVKFSGDQTTQNAQDNKGKFKGRGKGKGRGKAKKRELEYIKREVDAEKDEENNTDNETEDADEAEELEQKCVKEELTEMENDSEENIATEFVTEEDIKKEVDSEEHLEEESGNVKIEGVKDINEETDPGTVKVEEEGEMQKSETGQETEKGEDPEDKVENEMLNEKEIEIAKDPESVMEESMKDKDMPTEEIETVKLELMSEETDYDENEIDETATGINIQTENIEMGPQDKETDGEEKERDINFNTNIDKSPIMGPPKPARGIRYSNMKKQMVREKEQNEEKAKRTTTSSNDKKNKIERVSMTNLE